MENAALAEQLEALAALLDFAGANRYSVRAYRRAAELIRATPAPVAELIRQGRVQELHGIGDSIEARLRELVETGRLAELDELEADAEAKVRAELERPRATPRDGLTLNRAWELIGGIAEALGGAAAGDPRRWCDLSYRLAVVVAGEDVDAVVARFRSLPEVVAIADRRDDGALGVTVEGRPVELVVASQGRFGTELLRATGSERYVAALGELPDAHDEETVYRRLGLPWLPPELREEPFRGAPPELLELTDIRGDLHVHTTWSDGRASVLEMAQAAAALGHEYVAICDHTKNVRVVSGLDADDVRRQGEEIAAANDQIAPLRVLRGIECDILADGTLDLPDDVLDELDWVQASIHAGQRQSRDQLTHRTLAAVHHPAVRSISHPQGRILNHRPANAVDLEAVYAACIETGTALETNGLPDRIDLSSTLVRDAIRAGVRITCSTDAHSVGGLQNMQLSVATARRGWCTAAEVLNTRPLADFL
jgi:DNA polymerase (family 10)